MHYKLSPKSKALVTCHLWAIMLPRNDVLNIHTCVLNINCKQSVVSIKMSDPSRLVPVYLYRDLNTLAHFLQSQHGSSYLIQTCGRVTDVKTRQSSCLF